MKIPKIDEERELKNKFSFNTIPKFSFKDKVKIEIYRGKNKEIGYNIIKNMDMMMYHYFGQEYHVVKGATILVLVYIEYNNLKHYIGFISMDAPTLNKKIRNLLLGKQFFKNVYHFSRLNNLETPEIYTFNRIVLLPNFRGLGLSKHIQSEVIKQLKDIFLLEITSSMLHSFDFITEEFNKSSLSLDKRFFIGDTKIKKDPKNFKGYKGESKFMGGLVFYINFKEEYKKLLQQYYKKVYNFNINLDDITKLNNTLDLSKYKYDDLLYLYEKGIPLVFLNFKNIEELKQLEYKQPNYNFKKRKKNQKNPKKAIKW